eukprot:1205605-Rhodomonas_salina.2
MPRIQLPGGTSLQKIAHVYPPRKSFSQGVTWKAKFRPNFAKRTKSAGRFHDAPQDATEAADNRRGGSALREVPGYPVPVYPGRATNTSNRSPRVPNPIQARHNTDSFTRYPGYPGTRVLILNSST